MLISKKESFVALSLATAALIISAATAYVSTESVRKAAAADEKAEKGILLSEKNERDLRTLKIETADNASKIEMVKKAVSLTYDLASQSENSGLKTLEGIKGLVQNLKKSIDLIYGKTEELYKREANATARIARLENVLNELKKEASQKEDSSEEKLKLLENRINEEFAKLKKAFLVADATKEGRSEEMESLRRSIALLEKKLAKLESEKEKARKRSATETSADGVPFVYVGAAKGKKDRGYIKSLKSGKRFELGVGTVINGRWKVEKIERDAMYLFDKKTRKRIEMEKRNG